MDIDRPLTAERLSVGRPKPVALITGASSGIGAALARHWRVDRRFEPALATSDSAARRAEWREALSRSKGWAARDH